ncbi:hypothetical protein NQ315_002314 [Exocentrus adspersus]|uniref:Uncharacterized protein n=1 Tax=Exocentrus adspersus TaxID=1586481 RepID=A0AAV8VSD5_9CUCU|nr:hypothetical protein NQ315_002314 [Exocentrus adspersus]
MEGVITYDISPIKGPLVNAFLILINTLFFNLKLVGPYDAYPRDYSQALLNEDEVMFDFIIVGGGAAGCALANRLSEESTWSVLLIEAGDYPPPSSDVPGLYFTFFNSNEDWKYYMENDPKACQVRSGNRCVLSRGKVLGGTSTISNMRYWRDIASNFDRLATPLFASKVVFDIFREMEGYEGTDQEQFQYTYGTEGPIYLNVFNYTSPVKDLLQDTYKAIGYNKIPKRKFLGYANHLTYIKNGERFNMAKAFLTPVKERKNLFLTKNTEVDGVVVNVPLDNKVGGVNVSIDGVKFFIRARKEVVLTSGAINNAKLLLISGIGPKAYLQSKNIPVVADVPGVGKNLHLHLYLPIFVSIGPCGEQPAAHSKEIDLIRDIFNYLIDRSGGLSHTGINQLATYISVRKDGTTTPNLGVYHEYFKIGDRALMAALDAVDYHPTVKKTLLETNQKKSIVLFMVSLLESASRGEVSLNDTHHLSNPKITPNFMTDDEQWDYATLLSGFNFVYNLTQVETLREYDAELLDINIPNCRNFKFCTMAYVKCYIHNMVYPNPDTAGTAKMGEECDPTAVVRKDLEVKGVRCLRVADSSVLGDIPTGNTVPADAMIGFSMGEILKSKWLKDYQSPYYNTEETPLDPASGISRMKDSD